LISLFIQDKSENKTKISKYSTQYCGKFTTRCKRSRWAYFKKGYEKTFAQSIQKLHYHHSWKWSQYIHCASYKIPVSKYWLQKNICNSYLKARYTNSRV